MIKRHGFPKYILLIIDVFAILSAYTLSYWIRFHQWPWANNLSGYFLFFLIIPLSFLIFRDHNLYKHHIYASRAEQTIQLLKSLLIITVLIVVYDFFFRTHTFKQSRFLILFFGASVFGILILLRVVFFNFLYPFFAKTKIMVTSALIIGTGQEAEMVAARIIGDELIPINIIGFLNGPNDHHVDDLFSLPILGTVQDLENIVVSQKAQKIIIAFNNVPDNEFFKIYDQCKKTGLPVLLSTKHFDVVKEKLNNYEYDALLGIRLPNYEFKKLDRLQKRVIDLVLAGFGLIVLSPLFLVIAIIIKFTSNGPVLFRQKRLGENARPFNFYKFRSMVINNDNALHQNFLKEFINNSASDRNSENKTFKIKYDPRVTKIGKFLRKTSLDELPQLINVIKGDMSLVGPRPCLEYEYKMYQEWHKRRLNAMPGITGLWQVRGRSAVSFNDMVAMDLYYIESWSIWSDFKLMLQTIPVVLTGRGAL